MTFQSKHVRISLLLSFILFAVAISCNRSADDKPSERTTLTVAMDEQMPGYFEFGGQSYGYQYDLLKAYADARGWELRVVKASTPTAQRDLLDRGQVDFLTTLAAHVTSDERSREVPIYSTNYVLLTTSDRAAAVRSQRSFDLSTAVGAGRLFVSSGFRHTDAFDRLLDSLPDAQIYVASDNSFDQIEALSKRDYDWMICEMSEAQLGCALSRHVEQVYRFTDPVELSVVAAHGDEVLQHDFEQWLGTFRCGTEYAELNDLYFEKGIVRQVVGEQLTEKGRISAFDHIFKEVCSREGYDWRFVAAIAYSESRFNPTLVSRRGAQGLMQVMPAVARQFSVSGSVMDPQNNILLGIHLLSRIEKSLKFTAGTSDHDRKRIVLACYNGGIGHVTDARNLARKYGGNPDSWEDVSYYLTRKSEPQYAADVRNGAFVGRQTLAFVDGVMNKYSAYCRRVMM